MKKRVCTDCGFIETIAGAIEESTGKKSCSNCSSTKVFDEKQQSSANPQKLDTFTPQNESANTVRWFNSLQFRFAGALIVLTLFILGGFTYLEYSSSKKASMNNLQQLAEIASDRMSKYLVEPLWGVEEEQIRESLSSEMLDEQIQSIIVYDNDTRNVLVGKKRGDNGKLLDVQKVERGNFITSSRPIIRREDSIGAVEVSVTPEIALEKLHRSTLGFAFTTFFLCFAILATVFFLLRNLILSPIKIITDAADKMSLGDLEIKLPHHLNNEIGFLADSIQRMQSSLKIAFRKLNKR